VLLREGTPEDGLYFLWKGKVFQIQSFEEALILNVFYFIFEAYLEIFYVIFIHQFFHDRQKSHFQLLGMK